LSLAMYPEVCRSRDISSGAARGGIAKQVYGSDFRGGVWLG
jgi:hypothetical protein